MKKTTVLMIVLMISVLASVAVAGDKGAGMVGRLFLFQKCDPALAPIVEDPATEENAVTEDDALPQYDKDGCPTAPGPWPIFPDNRRWGQMKYNILGPEFKYAFQGKNLDPDVEYKLIYYPDPWPGEGLIVLGSDKSNKGGNVQINGKMPIPNGLPQPGDGNYTATKPSGATGAKIWLVLSSDIECGSITVKDAGGNDVLDDAGEPQLKDSCHLVNWNPGSYLFEGNLIIYQPTESLDAEEDGENDGSLDNGEDVEEQETEGEEAPIVKNNNGNAYGRDKQR